MGTICSTTRSVRVRENKAGCDQTPPRNQQYKGATSYTHRYTSIQSKEDKSLMVANTYALESLQNELKHSEEKHFTITVDEPITDEQPESLTNAVIDTSLNETQMDPPETTESIESEIEIITVASKDEIIDEQPEFHINAVINTSPNQPEIDPTETKEPIDNESENIEIEQLEKPEITDEQPEYLKNAVNNTSPIEPQIDLPETTESIDNESENIAIEQQQLVKPEKTDEQLEQQLVKPEITDEQLEQQLVKPEITDEQLEQQLVKPEITDEQLEQQLVKPEITDEQLEQQPVKTEITCEQPESLTNAVINTSPNEPPETKEPIDNEIENIEIEQQLVKPEITESDFPDSIISTDPTQPAYTTELSSTPIDTTYNISQMIEEPNLNITTGVTACKTEDNSVDDIPKSPESTNAFDNTLVMNSTVVGNETIEYPELTQGLESDLTNVTRELDEAATDIVESALNKNIFVTPNITPGIEEVPNNGDI